MERSHSIAFYFFVRTMFIYKKVLLHNIALNVMKFDFIMKLLKLMNYPFSSLDEDGDEVSLKNDQDCNIFKMFHLSSTKTTKLLVKSLESGNATKQKIAEPVVQKILEGEEAELAATTAGKNLQEQVKKRLKTGLKQ